MSVRIAWLLLLPVAFAVCAGASEEPAWGTLKVSITRTPSGEAMPGKVVLLHAGSGQRARLLGQSSRSQVVRPQAAYTISGTVELPVIPGDYRVLAGCGMEYSVAEGQVSIPPGGEISVDLALKREVETPGYIPADLHLHTIFSDGNPSLEERVIALAGEGIKFAAATDHNHVTDYGPVVAGMGAGAHLACIPGDEVTTWGKDRIGHFCAYPVPSGSDPIPATADTGKGIFSAIRAVPGRPIVHVAHPRWDDGAYFTHAAVGLFTGRAGPRFSPDFDVIEIMNEDRLWGWIVDPRVKEDWFNLLNRGLRFAALAVSDSHGAWYSPNGLPRTYIASAEQDCRRLRTDALMTALRERRCTSASGVFLELEVNGEPMGGETPARKGRALAAMRVRAPSWIKVSEIVLVANGETAAKVSVPTPGAGRPTDFSDSLELELKEDSWVLAYASGPDVEHPLYSRPVHAQAATNPVWVDADADGRFEPMLKGIERAVRDLPARELWREAGERPIRWVRMLIGELYDRGGEKARDFLERAAESAGDIHAAFLDVAGEEERPAATVWRKVRTEAPVEEWGLARVVLQGRSPAKEEMSARLTWEPAEGISLEPAEMSVRLAPGEDAREELAVRWPADAPPPRITGRAVLRGGGALPSVERLAVSVYPAMRLARLKSALKLDGKLKEWGAKTRVPGLFGEQVGTVMLARADTDLAFAAKVRDASIYVPDTERFWEGDYLELFLDFSPDRGGDSYRKSSHHLWIRPARNAGLARAETGRWHHAGDALEETVRRDSGIRAVCRPTREGYVLEGAIPVALLTGGGELPDRLFFNYHLCDKWTGSQFFSSPSEEETHDRPGTWGVLLSPPKL